MTDHYRRLVGQDEWHFCINCSKWPTDDYVLSKTKPVTDKLCNECQTKQQAGDAAYRAMSTSSALSATEVKSPATGADKAV
jgi:hypothetical protein